jgi:hypothetical protein
MVQNILKLFSIVFLSFLSNVNGLVIPMYDRSLDLPVWEQTRLTYLANHFDGVGTTITQRLAIAPTAPGDPPVFTAQQDAFVTQFIACSKAGIEYIPGRVDNPMRVFLTEVANNSIGRETMYRIMAKLEPRIECVDSIATVIAAMDSATTPDLMQRVNICAAFLRDIGVLHDDADSANFVTFGTNNTLDNNVRTTFDNFLNTPHNPFVIRNLGWTLTAPGASAQAATLLGNIVPKLIFFKNALQSSVNRLRFRLVYEPAAPLADHYDPADNKVSITGLNCSGNLVMGPILKNIYEPVAVETMWGILLPRSSLKHELGHYLRLGLENVIKDGTFFVAVGPALFHLRVSSNYLSRLSGIWTDTEELTEIFGIHYVAGSILYDHLNQSEFNLEDGVAARYAHIKSRFPLVPSFLFNIFTLNNTRALPIANTEEVFYDESRADI